jgi:DNA-binding transcriptional LysR family regulator
VFAHARRLRLSVEDISREVADLSQARTGHLRIGTAPAFAHDLVARVCEILHQQAPKITFKVVTGDREARVGGLRSGTLDLVITSLLPERHEDLTEEPLHDEEFVVYCSATHPLAKRRPLRVADLAQERWALPGLNEPPWRHLSQALGNAGLPAPVVGIETTDLTLRQRMVASSRMLTFGSREAAKHAAGRLRVVELPVKDLIYVRRVGVLYRRDSYLSPAARRFIEILKVTCGQVAARTR